MNKKYKNNKLKLHFILLGLIIFSTFFLSIGYAALESIILDINGEVTAIPQSNIFITDVQYNTSVNTDSHNSTINQYYQTMMQSTVILGIDSNSSITYDITIYNSGNEPHIFEKVEYTEEFYDNPNITFDLNGLKKYDVINPKEYITFSITFHYLNNTVSASNILNSYLNFKFIKGILGTNIVTTPKQINIYNADTDKLQFEVTNSNEFAVNVNLKIDNYIIDTMSLASGETVTINKIIKDGLPTMQSNQEYTVAIEQIEPYQFTKQSSVKLKLIPTITNYDFGLKDAGTEQNPYIIYKIEDLVRLSKKVNSGDTISSKNFKQICTLDFKAQTDYYNYKDISFGNLNENNNDGNQILTEMTTGSGFSVIGESTTNPFNGIFDGGNNKLENLYIKRTHITTDIKTALFGYINNATIKNLSITGTIELSYDGAAFIGGAFGNCSVLNCHNYASIINEQNECSCGGLIAALMANSVVVLDGCSNRGTVTNVTSTAGLVGFVIASTLNINNCYNIGTVTSTYTGTEENGKSSFTAGLVSKDSSGGGTINIINSYNAGEINGKYNLGGIISRISGHLEINSCYNIGKVNGLQYIGGILGNNSPLYGGTNTSSVTIQNSYNIGELLGTSDIGGIIGYQNISTADITKAYYLTKTNLLNIGNIPGVTTCSRTNEYMKSSEFVTLLGNNFKSDTNNINSGYPILISQE